MKPLRILWVILLIILWQVLYSLNIFPLLVLPSISQVIKQLSIDFQSGELIKALLLSILIIIVAVIPSFLVGFLMAFFSFRFSKIDSFMETLAALAHPLPGIALLPLLILWTGLGIHIIILIIVHSVLWPFYINIRSGFKEIPQLWIDLGRNNEFSKKDEFLYILLPAAFPSILAGAKIAWARAWRAVINAEMIFGTIGNAGGLGWFIYNKRIFMDTPGMYGGIVILMIIGLIVDDFIFKKLEQKTALQWGNFK